MEIPEGNSVNKEIAAQYLIAEFEMLHQRAEVLENQISSRTNFFIGLTTAILGGLLFIF